MGAFPDNCPEKVRELYRNCVLINDRALPYHYGGGHYSFNRWKPYPSGLDCSSSTSRALWVSGMYRLTYPMVSGNFYTWGQPGMGKWFTVWYSPVHVWIQFHIPGVRYRRFDTSPHGSWTVRGSMVRGPRMRWLPRSTAGFKPRHWPGF